jgi:hypothetical protein
MKLFFTSQMEIPTVANTPAYCTRLSVEQANKQSKEATEKALLELHQIRSRNVQQKKHHTSDSDSDYSSSSSSRRSVSVKPTAPLPTVVALNSKSTAKDGMVVIYQDLMNRNVELQTAYNKLEAKYNKLKREQDREERKHRIETMDVSNKIVDLEEEKKQLKVQYERQLKTLKEKEANGADQALVRGLLYSLLFNFILCLIVWFR